MFSTLRKCGTYRNEEYSHVRRGSQGRTREGSFFRGSFGRRNLHYERTGYGLQPSTPREDDGNVEMRDVHEDPQVRYTPYSTWHNKRRGKWHGGHQIRISVCREQNPREREMGEDAQDGSFGNWFKVTIPYGRKYEKTWLMNSIQDLCSVPFTPVDFHYVKSRAQFFVQDASTASALRDVSYKIRDEENRKVSVLVSPSAAVPYSVKNKFTPQQIEQLKLAMSKRYDASQQSLNLQKLRFDPDLVGHDIDMFLNRRNCMGATLQIIERDFPEMLSLNLGRNKLYQLDGLSDIVEKAPQVKILNLSKNELRSVKELEKVKELKLEELWLEGNPLCSTFPDKSAYISAVRDCFPTLIRLDGQELSPPTVTDIGALKSLNPSKESYKGSETLKNLVLQFLQEYFLIYDYGDRQRLLSSYHDEACFSLTIPFNPQDPAPSSLCEYLKYSRNMMQLKDSRLRMQLLKHTKRDIVDSLILLPKTEHDFTCFKVDMWCQSETMLGFSVRGVFKEVEGTCQGCVRVFMRTFVATPGNNRSLCIMNDQLFLRDAIPAEIPSTFSVPMPILCSSSRSTLSQEQQEMVQAFSTQSGMKLDWSQKCLEDNGWDYTKAGQVFTMLQKEGKIPKEAFKQMS